MRDPFNELLLALRLETLDTNLFQGPSQDLGWGAVFGGQVLGQALSAAAQTVPADRPVHSLHGYFLRQGDATRPIVYEVDRIRDGGTFTTRRVVALQGGKAIFSLSASFQQDELGHDHQEPTAPDAPAPETLWSEAEWVERLGDRLPIGLRSVDVARPIEIRPIDVADPVSPEPQRAYRRVWMKTAGTLPDDPAVHRYLLAYASDFYLLTTALLPMGLNWLTPGMQVASLDHAMWFHRPFRFDDWLLYEMTGPTTQGARGLAMGRFFDRQGRLVASTAQEGLVRDHDADRRATLAQNPR